MRVLLKFQHENVTTAKTEAVSMPEEDHSAVLCALKS
jgi:hypothetical protein